MGAFLATAHTHLPGEFSRLDELENYMHVLRRERKRKLETLREQKKKGKLDQNQSKMIDSNNILREPRETPLERAMRYAMDVEVAALHALVLNHNLQPHLLSILENIPECVAPITYASLLSLGWTQRRAQEIDECTGLINYSLQLVDTVSGLLYHSVEESHEIEKKEVEEKEDTSGELVALRLLSDCKENDKKEKEENMGKEYQQWDDSGHTCNSRLCNTWMKQLQKIRKELEAVSLGVYQLGKEDLTLRHYQNLPPYEQFCCLVDGWEEGNEENNEEESDEKEYKEYTSRGRIADIICVVLRTAAYPSRSTWIPYVKRYVVHCAQRGCIQACREVVYASRPVKENPISQRPIQHHIALLHIALEAIYACPNTHSWKTMDHIFECLPERSSKAALYSSTYTFKRNISKEEKNSINNDEERRDKKRGVILKEKEEEEEEDDDDDDDEIRVESMLQDRVDLMEDHLSASVVLERYQCAQPLAFYLHVDEQTSKQLMTKLAHKLERVKGRNSREMHIGDGRSERRNMHIYKMKEDDGSSEWEQLLLDVLAVREKVFPHVSEDHCYKEYCGALLRAGRFQLAENVIGRVKEGERAALVLDAAQVHFNSAASVRHKEMRLAQETLDVLLNPHHPLNVSPTSIGIETLEAEARLIEGVRLLTEEYGVEGLLPVQVRLRLPDHALNLVVKAISNEASSTSSINYNPDGIVHLATLLVSGSLFHHASGLHNESSSPKTVVPNHVWNVGLECVVECKVLHLIGLNALVVKDNIRALMMCNRLMNLQYTRAWDLALATATLPTLYNTKINQYSISKSDRLRLASFASAYCPSNHLDSVLSLQTYLNVQMWDKENVVHEIEDSFVESNMYEMWTSDPRTLLKQQDLYNIWKVDEEESISIKNSISVDSSGYNPFKNTTITTIKNKVIEGDLPIVEATKRLLSIRTAIYNDVITTNSVSDHPPCYSFHPFYDKTPRLYGEELQESENVEEHIVKELERAVEEHALLGVTLPEELVSSAAWLSCIYHKDASLTAAYLLLTPQYQKPRIMIHTEGYNDNSVSSSDDENDIPQDLIFPSPIPHNHPQWQWFSVYLDALISLLKEGKGKDNRDTTSSSWVLHAYAASPKNVLSMFPGLSSSIQPTTMTSQQHPDIHCMHEISNLCYYNYHLQASALLKNTLNLPFSDVETSLYFLKNFCSLKSEEKAFKNALVSINQCNI